MGNKYLTPTPIHKSLLFSEIYLFKWDDKTRELIFDSQLFLFLGTIFSLIYSAHEIHPGRFQKLAGLLANKIINIRVLIFWVSCQEQRCYKMSTVPTVTFINTVVAKVLYFLFV